MKFLLDKSFLVFVIKFLLLFAVLYYMTIALIGLAAPGGYYSPFADKYLDYVSGIKNMLLYCTKATLYIFNIHTQIEPGYIIRIMNGRGVKIAMDCVGYGVYSFWIAYVCAHKIPAMKKFMWVFFGLAILFTINDIRISLFLYAINQHWSMPLGIDHHTWFTIFAYLSILIMICLFNKNLNTSVSVI